MSVSEPARSIADLDGGIILATITIAAPPERVFRALTASDEIVKWWGAEQVYRTTGWTADLRPGGSWRAEGQGADGKPFSVGGEFLEVDAPRKLVQTWKPDWDEGQATTLTYRLDATPAGTRLTVRHEGFAGRADSCRDHAQGWEGVLGWLAGYVSPAAEPVAAKFFFCRLLAPRPTFAFDMTAEERIVMQEHGAYLREQMKQGKVVLFGPVADPQGPWGLGVLRVADEAAAHALTAADPAVLSGRGLRYEMLPMIQAVTAG
jgi:uncharacterized protein YndB with AHSA1/START domain